MNDPSRTKCRATPTDGLIGTPWCCYCGQPLPPDQPAGVGFLGAGAILHESGGIQGLTTAATVWATAAIGLAAGCRHVLMSLETAILRVLFLRFGPRPNRGEGRTTGSECSRPRVMSKLAVRYSAGLSATAFILHYAWENIQCPQFVHREGDDTMWIAMLSATLGDVTLT